MDMITVRPQERYQVNIGLTQKGKDLFLMLVLLVLVVSIIPNSTDTTVLASGQEYPKAQELIQVPPGYFIRPLQGGWPTGGVGMTEKGKFHKGVDIATEIGTPIVAAADGKIVRSGWWGGYGICIVIQHSNGIQTLYGHLSEMRVSFGEEVSQGQLIALSGNTGHVESRNGGNGAHLHFEVHRAENFLQKEYERHVLRHPQI